MPFAQTAQSQAAAPRAAPTPVSVPSFESAGSPAKEAISARGLGARWLFIGMHPACLAFAGGPSLALCMHKADDDDTGGCDPRAAAETDDAGKKTAAQVLRAQLETELELELIKSHMAQKPVLRGEVGCACVAREVSVSAAGNPIDGAHASPALEASMVRWIRLVAYCSDPSLAFPSLRSSRTAVGPSFLN